MGELALKPWEFWELTVPQFLKMAKGYHARREWDFNLQWDQTRHVMAILINVNRGKDTPVVTGQQLMPLSTDKKEPEKEVPVPTLDYMEELINRRRIKG